MKFFKNAQSWVGEDKNNPFDFSNQLAGLTPKDVRELSEETSESVRERVRKGIRERSWMVKAARNAGFLNPVERITSLTPLLSAIVVIAEITRGSPPADIIRCVLLTAGLVVACNPWRTIERFIAIQSRILICLNIALLFLQMTKGVREWAGVIVWTAITALVVKLMNDKWLQAHNWLASKSVVSAIVQAPDNSGVNAWNDYGKREVRTVYCETGMEYDDDTLLMYGKTSYIIGFIDAFKKTDAVERRAEKAESNIRTQREKILLLETEKAELQQKLDIASEELEKLKRQEDTYRNRFEFAEKRAAELRKENEELRKANDQLVEAAPDVVPDEEDLEGKVVRFLSVVENGKRKYSYQDVSDLCDGKIKKTKVGEIAKAHGLNNKEVAK